MQSTYIFGHKRPDTDSVCASISLSYLKNELGEKTEPRVLGTINKETKFALDYFGVEEPKFLNDVKVQMRNMFFNKDVKINENISIASAFDAMHDFSVTGLPLVNSEGLLTGYANLKEVAKFLIEGSIDELYTSYDNIVSTLNGKSILKFQDEIKGSILAAAYRSETFVDRIKLTKDQILIVADRYNILKYAVTSGVQLVILVGGSKMPDELIEIAKNNKVNIIETPYTTFKTANTIKISNYIKTINVNKDPIKFYLHDYRNDFVDIANKYGHTNYPIVNRRNECLGMIRLIDINNYERKKVILVDHNQKDQTVDGIDEAEIVEVIDHHNLGTIGTSIPINFRAMPVGCTNTIIYKMFLENQIEIPKDIAGIMASAIISDTLLFMSPTTTEIDKQTCLELCEIAGIDVNKYGFEMFKAGSSIKGMDIDDIFNQDFKTYKASDDTSIGISQVMTMDVEEIEDNKDKYIDIMNNMYNMYGYKAAVMFVTDAIKNGSYIYYNDASCDIVAESFDLKDIYQGVYIDGLVSRKKQMLPPLLECVERKN